MKRLTVGIFAHVDAGKTTLSEAILYTAGALRSVGRVDHGDAFLDTEAVERERGITVFSKQAIFSYGGTEFTLLDTPGHVDFFAEAERTFSVLDAAVLVISGTDGVQSHTRTIWQMLRRHCVPTFLFVNKADLPGVDRAAVLESIRKELSPACVDFSAPTGERDEAIALCDEGTLEQFLSDGAVADGAIVSLIGQGKLFPCCFGAALRLDGVEAFLSVLAKYADAPSGGASFGARVFKISRDAQGTRLTWMKVSGGTLKAKMPIAYDVGGEHYEEKADQLRLYSGAKFRPIDEASAGTVVAVTGLSRTTAGQGLGAEPSAPPSALAPVLSYCLLLPPEVDAHTALPLLRQLEEEDPTLRLLWNEHSHEIRVHLMGQVQLEILQRLIRDRFGWEVAFDAGSIVYHETVAQAVEGIGHFEPLRHYAEVHLLIEPLPRGRGIELCSICATDDLAANWQRLVLTHLAEREHIGVLTGSVLTDVRITLAAGRAHVKHTEGGDFRQATYRAVRQGLMHAQNVLLEPYYDFMLVLPAECVGRAMTDIAAMGGTAEAPQTEGETVRLCGRAPVAAMRDYAATLAVYTRGRGQLSCAVGGYEPCHNADEVIAAIGYDAERDIDNPADSVFCDHGSGVTVKWSEVPQMAHLPCVLASRQADAEAAPVRPFRGGGAGNKSFEDDADLRDIFERTYGKIERPAFEPRTKSTEESASVKIAPAVEGPEYLLVDGYNIIFAWEELKALAQEDISAARSALIDLLSNYQGFRKCVVILVFDAYRVKGNPGSVEKVNDVFVVYTKEAETADAYIERTTYDLRREHRVRVATSDALEQVIILGHGALRISARLFREEVMQTQGQLADWIARHNASGSALRTLRHTARIVEEEKE